MTAGGPAVIVDGEVLMRRKAMHREAVQRLKGTLSLVTLGPGNSPGLPTATLFSHGKEKHVHGLTVAIISGFVSSSYLYSLSV